MSRCWRRPDYGEVSPEEFVPLAERAELIDDLTHRASLGAERRGAAWHSGALQIPVAVNPSPLNLPAPTFPGFAEQLVSSGGLAADLLQPESIDNAVMEDVDLA